MILEIAILVCFPAAMCLAASMDLFTMTIPNRITLFLIATFFLLAPFAGLTLTDIAMHTAAGFSMLIVAMTLFAFGWIGGGDAKIFAATALWFGFEHLLEYIVISSLLGGLLTIALLSWRQKPIQRFLLREKWAMHLHDLKTGIPYGIALGAAALIIYPDTSWMQMLVK